MYQMTCRPINICYNRVEWHISRKIQKNPFPFDKDIFKNSLDAGIQDESTSISIVVKVDLWLEKKKLMKVTNIYKHEIVDTRA